MGGENGYRGEAVFLGFLKTTRQISPAKRSTAPQPSDPCRYPSQFPCRYPLEQSEEALQARLPLALTARSHRTKRAGVYRPVASRSRNSPKTQRTTQQISLQPKEQCPAAEQSLSLSLQFPCSYPLEQSEEALQARFQLALTARSHRTKRAGVYRPVASLSRNSPKTPQKTTTGHGLSSARAACPVGPAHTPRPPPEVAGAAAVRCYGLAVLQNVARSTECSSRLVSASSLPNARITARVAHASASRASSFSHVSSRVT